MGFLKWMLGLVVLAVLAVGGGLALALYFASPSTTYTNTPLIPFEANAAPSGQTGLSSPVIVPASVSLPVPFTSQAPLNDWAAKQHTCEEATLVMVDRYLRGDHSGALIDPQTANKAINQISAWKPTLDLTDDQYGAMAKKYLGWDYHIYAATRQNIEQQLALGRPVIVGVRTHGLGNSNYPGYRTHFEQPGWSVSHYIVVAGYDSTGNVILNDPGLTRGHGYKISFDQLFHAIDDLDQAYPSLNQGRIILVLAPAAAS